MTGVGGWAELVKGALPLVQLIARRLARRLGNLASYDDLVASGNLAVVEMTHTWDPERASFNAYVGTQLGRKLMDFVRRDTHGRSRSARFLAVVASEGVGAGFTPEGDEPTTEEQDQAAFAAALGGHALAMGLVLLSQPTDGELAPALGQTPEALLGRAQLVQRIRDAIHALPDRERTLMVGHYYEGEPLESIGRRLGITKSWASRLHARALQQVREVALAA